ncbi:MAG: hypothetical protein GPJ02_00640 [Microcystis aeruginosa G13-12]|jgi:hypothetical protein|uniref:hypothetical protein n=1 Tax=Microcystis sp. LSC13-02 TaxID=1895004 RepID=UPI00257BAF65|nr:hypothetical protein [Microcystis sp. LSC13-02]NCR42829.1 hypothetical protein [Microcystis aeruginosa SX13-01]NCS00874.1 hypothetical protein [Microcystis aeruginosa G13-11]NCS11043.1 hypothetical protein [Microcystis aeruginosa G13-09]NCS14178.1 hypothetical protein [Microcystis aeruginosa G13-12]NCT50374.1 hypothetical protein [Microcystis aeruginosa G13-03]
MSIDDPRQVRFLIEKMEASLPIPVRATPETLKLAETKGERYKPDHQFSIDKIFYTGDEGGIICSLKNELGKQTGLVCSLTHLRIDNDHPLAADIQSYQKKRSMRIALQDGKTGKALRIAKQNRPNKGFGK